MVGGLVDYYFCIACAASIPYRHRQRQRQRLFLKGRAPSFGCAPVSKLPLVAPNEFAGELTCSSSPAPALLRRLITSFARRRADKGASVSGVAVFLVVFVAAAVVGLGVWGLFKASGRASNPCKMTYSTPKYVPLPVAGYPARGGVGEGETAGDNPGYGYRVMRFIDRKLPESDKADPLRPRGIPVLFVPGHVGNYEQVCYVSLTVSTVACKCHGSRGGVLCVGVCILLYPSVSLLVGRPEASSSPDQRGLKFRNSDACRAMPTPRCTTFVIDSHDSKGFSKASQRLLKGRRQYLSFSLFFFFLRCCFCFLSPKNERTWGCGDFARPLL